MNSDRPILLLKTGEPPAPVKAEHGDFERWMSRGLARPLSRLHTANVYLGEPLPDPAEVSAVIVTGSPAMVTDRAEWSEASGRWLAKVVAEDELPVLGICYGHQLIADALGGRVDQNPRGRETGTFEVQFDAASEALAPLFKEAGDAAAGEEALLSFPAHFSHLESVVELPSGAIAMASSALEPHAAIAFGPRQWGVQYHPEFDPAIMRGYLEARRSVIGEEGGDVDALLAAVRETPKASSVLERFARFVESRSD